MSANITRWLLPQLFFCLNMAGVMIYGVTAMSLASDLKLSAAQVGSLGGTYFMAYAVSQLLLGSSLGSLPPRLLLGVTALASAGGAFLMSIAQSYEIALLARLLMGIGFGTAMVGVVYFVGLLFRNKYAFMINLSQSIASGVAAFLGLLGPLPLLQNFRLPFLIISLLLLTNGILILLFVKDGSKTNNGDTPAGEPASLAKTLGAIFANGQFWIGTIYFTGLFSSFLAYADLWNIRFQADVFHHTGSQAAMINSGVVWGLTLGGIVTGMWANQAGFIKPARVCAWMSLILLAILYTKPILPWLAISLMIALGFFMGGAPLGIAVMNAHVPEKFQAIASPILLTIAFLSGGLLMSSVGSSLAGLLPHAFSTYRVGLNWFMVPIAVAAVASLMMKPARSTTG